MKKTRPCTWESYVDRYIKSQSQFAIYNFWVYCDCIVFMERGGAAI